MDHVRRLKNTFFGFLSERKRSFNCHFKADCTIEFEGQVEGGLVLAREHDVLTPAAYGRGQHQSPVSRLTDGRGTRARAESNLQKCLGLLIVFNDLWFAVVLLITLSFGLFVVLGLESFGPRLFV